MEQHSGAARQLPPVGVVVGNLLGQQRMRSPTVRHNLGILIKGSEVLESTRVDTVVLDETGTVTTGREATLRLLQGDADNDQS